MANMKIAIRFWWKASNDGGDSLTISIAAVLVGATRQVMIDDLAQKVGGLSKIAGRRFGGFAILGHAPIVEKTPAYKEKSPQTAAGSFLGSARELIFYESLFTGFLNRRQGHDHN
jgi:hypothetical protein